MVVIGLTLLAFGATPLTGLAAEPKASAPKPTPKSKQTSEAATPDTIKAGGKSLSQWRAIFGETSKSPQPTPFFSKPAAAAMPQGNIAASANTPSLAGREGRRTVERIVHDAQKTYWTRLAVIANNLANADTVAYKRNRTLLEGVESWSEAKGNDWSRQGQMAAAGIAPSGGGPVLNIQTDFRQGRLIKTGQMLDIAIEGKGFFQVMDPRTGETIYTRAGNLSVNCNGSLTVGRHEASAEDEGLLLEPSITVPQDATSVFINPMGVVSVQQPGSITRSQIGQIMLASFINPQGLQRLGGKFFAETDFSGSPICVNPGQDSLGVIRQGHLEGSNVCVADELKDQRETAERIKTLGRTLPK